jgi:hypothetical protein
MAVYVDKLAPCVTGPKWPYTHSCHLMADSVDELKAFAAKLGLKPEWFQDHATLPHFDLTAIVRAKAIAAGAEPIDSHRVRMLISRQRNYQRKRQRRYAV